MLTADIGIAFCQDQLTRFFNNIDDPSCLPHHIATLDHIIADFTGVSQMHARARGYQRELRHDNAVPTGAGVKKFGRINGAAGGTGGWGDHSGGAGGKGGSFKLKMASQTTYEFGDLTVGQGGAGGDSKIKGGQAGSGGDVEIIEDR